MKLAGQDKIRRSCVAIQTTLAWYCMHLWDHAVCSIGPSDVFATADDSAAGCQSSLAHGAMTRKSLPARPSVGSAIVSLSLFVVRKISHHTSTVDAVSHRQKMVARRPKDSAHKVHEGAVPTDESCAECCYLDCAPSAVRPAAQNAKT